MAGAKPNKAQVKIPNPAVNKKIRQSRFKSTRSGFPSVVRNATKNRLNPCAKSQPKAAPMKASRRLSVINWRNRRNLEAPSARRTTISRSRVLALASKRLARFAQAISKTTLAIAKSNQSGLEYVSRIVETPVPAAKAVSVNPK